MTSAAASLGAIFLWNVELGLTEIDKYLYIEDDNIKVIIIIFNNYLEITLYLYLCYVLFQLYIKIFIFKIGWCSSWYWYCLLRYS